LCYIIALGKRVWKKSCRVLLIAVLVIHYCVGFRASYTYFKSSKEVLTAFITEGLPVQNFHPLKPNMFISPDGPEVDAGAIEFPLYHYIVIAFNTMFGNSLFMGRIVSQFLVLLSIMIFYLALESLLEPISALVGVTFFSMSVLTIYIAKSYQVESLMLFFLICAFYFNIKYLVIQDNKKYTYLYLSAIFIILSASQKIFALLYFMPLTFTIICNKEKLNRLLKFSSFALLVALPLSYWFYKRISLAPYGVSERFWNWPQWIKKPEFWKGSYRIFFEQITNGGASIFLFLVGGISLPFWSSREIKGLLISWFFGLIIYAVYTASHFCSHNYYQAQVIPFHASVIAGFVSFLLLRAGSIKKRWRLPISIALAVSILGFTCGFILKAGEWVGRSMRVADTLKGEEEETARKIKEIADPQNDYFLYLYSIDHGLFVFNLVPHAAWWFFPDISLEDISAFSKKARFTCLCIDRRFHQELDYNPEIIYFLVERFKYVGSAGKCMFFDFRNKPDVPYNGLIVPVVSLSGYEKVNFSNLFELYFSPQNITVRRGEKCKVRLYLAPLKAKIRRYEFFIFINFLEGGEYSIDMDKPIFSYLLPSENWRKGWAYLLEFSAKVSPTAPIGKYELKFGIFDKYFTEEIIKKCCFNLKVVGDSRYSGRDGINVGRLRVTY